MPRQVLVYLHRRRDDGARDFLLLRRTPARGGFWQGVSGAPGWGECDRDAAVREVLEETGLDVRGALAALDYRYELRPAEATRAEWRRVYGPGVEAVPEEVYEAEVAPGAEPVPAPNEHDAYRWCSLEEAIGLLRWRENRDALVALGEKLAGR